ncbi:transcription factor 20 [Brachionus plicatilis]|uniref:Transcription factor 20 n=1 Tax=Brachionus plicatilis TaxID=10195 RepID=A0A3M7T3H2_BRAPC|nr:transcription factor 20 [Brachionus plicatilis]
MITDDEAGKNENDLQIDEPAKTKKRLRKARTKNLKNKKIGVGKKRAGRKRLKNKTKTNHIDSDTEKFIKSFKNSNISKKKPRKVPESTDSKQVTTNGPVVQKINKKIQLNQHWVECSSYVVKNQAINDEDDAGKYKLVVPREKTAPKNPKPNDSDVKICSFCQMASNEVYGLGELFGPYYNEEKNDLELEDEEIFVHEGCATWTKDIFVYENKVYGLEKSVFESKEYKCSHCDKYGATLICKVLSCGKMFHFPCAVKNDVQFYTENFSIKCIDHE